MTRLRAWVILLPLALLPAACGESLDDAIAKAEVGSVTMDRSARQDVIDALRAGLEKANETPAAVRAKAAAWLGYLLVRHGRPDEARDLLENFEATAEQLVAAGDPVSALRGLGALGGAFVALQQDFDAPAPLRRALAIAAEHGLDAHPVVIAPMIDTALLTFLPGVGDDDSETPSEAAAAAEGILRQAEAIARIAGGPDDPRLGSIDHLRAFLVQGKAAAVGLSADARGGLVRTTAEHLVRALARLPPDHPDRVSAAKFLAELAAGACIIDEVETLSQEAVDVARTIYGDKAEKTFLARSAYGEMLMHLGALTRGRQMILDARTVRYGDGARTLQDPLKLYRDNSPGGCIDPPQ